MASSTQQVFKFGDFGLPRGDPSISGQDAAVSIGIKGDQCGGLGG